MKRLLAAFALFAAGPVLAQAPQTARMGITHATNPEVVSVLDAGNVWSAIGSVDKSTHMFTPVAGGTGGGGGPVSGGWLTDVVVPALPVSAILASATINSSASEVLIENVGSSIPAYCGVGTAATVNYKMLQPNGGWFVWQVNGVSQVSCIAAGNTVVNIQTGSGLATGGGGSSGGGGGGGSGGPLGTQPINNSQAVNPATSSIWNIAASSLPLPTGAALAANQPGINADGGALAHVTNFPGNQAVTVTSIPLPPGAALAANQTNGAAKDQAVDAAGNTLFVAGHPGLIACPDGTTACFTGSSTGGGGPLGTQPLTNSQAVNPATSSVWNIAAASLPLPTGGGTAANQATIIANQTNGTQVAKLSSPIGPSTTPAQALAFTDTGSPITGQAIPTGGQGISGWLSAIFSKIGTGGNLTPVGCGGTITTGGVAQNITGLGTTTNHGFTIANVDGTTNGGEAIWISFTGTATVGGANDSFPLEPQDGTAQARALGSYSTDIGLSHAVSIIAGSSALSTGHRYSCFYK